MITTTQCEHCGAAIEFESDSWQEGAVGDCPYCKQETRLTVPLPEQPVVSGTQQSLSSDEQNRINRRPAPRAGGRLILCPTCQNAISPNAMSCPKCGHQMTQPGAFNLNDPVHLIGFILCILFLMGAIGFMLFRLGAL